MPKKQAAIEQGDALSHTETEMQVSPLIRHGFAAEAQYKRLFTVDDAKVWEFGV